MVAASIPVTILTGFLGAGKTSLLNNLLLQQRQLKIAVIENEFGEVAIDNDLLVSNALSVADKVIVLENGCMCCTVRGDILGAFASIAEQVASGHPLDMVLIETTGMADPLPIVRTITQTPSITASFHMKGVVTLVDACNILTLLGSDNAEAQSQISLADLVILSKVDLVPHPHVHRDIAARIRDLNPTVPILPCVRGDLDFTAMFDRLSGFDLTKVEDSFDNSTTDDHNHHDHACHDQCDHHHGDNRHTQTKSFAIVEPHLVVDPFLFAHWMRRLVLPSKDSIAKNVVLYRSKAILSVAGMTNKLVFHAVGDVVDREWLDVPAVHGCKIVFIGRNLDERQVRADFDALLRPHRPMIVPGTSSATSERFTAMHAADPHLVHRIMEFATSKDVVRVASTCRTLHLALTNLQHPRSSSSWLGLAHDPRHGGPYLHPGVALPNIPTYMRAYEAANVEFVPFGGLKFPTAAHVDAAAVAWLELARLAEPSCRSYALDFTWRPETIAAFFGAPTPIQTSSALVKIEYDVAASDDFDEAATDILRFRVFLIPAVSGDDVAGYRLVFQLTGGRTSSQVYQISFHSIHPAFQVHVAVPDHRVPRAETKEVFYPGHPLLHAVQTEHALRFVVRVKPDGSGPLGEMCGCC
ncbi:hypothetical protein H257_12856 [Aphanomyces astaci]|uniref:CobW C-terminal domain-containing protein n=1 Tax=Aphanomyces astaci TaxID=112090 RepID=W4FZ73_APHAT|nr:hypothetical protein H257_12856 [Aphanomyces astaci]ETV72064.1 hypothetical protein H257_12856 [Aphanomyces astaci]RQM29827.1 hypothetical protein B5M09_013216 [Aphanomyces astaci]|eukprot:XP_009838507.1 hypothetical protein H257_12856 [Aphanomyces astaci]